MNKKIFALIVAGVLLGGCGMLKKDKPVVKKTIQPEPTLVEKSIEGLSAVKAGDGVELWLNSPEKVSALEFKITAYDQFRIISFNPNRNDFNTVLKNTGSGKEWQVSLGIIKTTDVLPKGKLLIGKVVGSGNGKLTFTGFKLVGPTTDGSPSRTKVSDLEFMVTSK